MAHGFLWLALVAGAWAGGTSWPDLSAPPPSLPVDGQRDAALLVGIENYAFLDDVDGAAQNVDDWRAYLRARGVPDPSIQVLVDRPASQNPVATREAILAKAARAAQEVEATGTLWVVFVGHGAPAAQTDDALLVASDATQSVLGMQANSVRRSELLAAVGRGRQSETVVVLDTCFSGQGQDGQRLAPELQPALATALARADDAVELLATSDNEYAGTLPGLPRPAFSYLVLGALRGWGDGAKNDEPDGQVTATEAVEYASDTLGMLLTGRTQRPTLRLPDGRSDLVLGMAAEEGPDRDTLRGVIQGSLVDGISGADCSLVRLDAGVRAAEGAWREGRRDVFGASLADAERTLGCLQDPISRDIAVRVHQVWALRAASGRDERDGVDALRAVLALGGELPSWLADDPQLQAWVAQARARGGDGSASSLPAPIEGQLLIDGDRAKRRPEERPFVFQWVDAGQEAQTSAYVAAGAPLPDMARWTGSDRPKRSRVGRTRKGRPVLKWGLGVGVAGLLSMAATIPTDRAAVSAYTSKNYGSGDTLRTINNGAFYGGIGLSAIGGALTVGGLISGR